MLLTDCILSADIVSMAPFQRTAPEEDWIFAERMGLIPKPLFDLYCRAGYLSFGAAPRFLKDDDHMLFSYFSLVLRSLMESLRDADEFLNGFVEAQALVYDPGKKIRREPWDAQADTRARRNFKETLNSLQTSLDSVADLIALFLPGFIPGLSVGRAQFARIEAWVRTPLSPLSVLLVSPTDHFLRKLREDLHPVIQAPLPEADWLGFMRLLRNKSAHMGQPLFRQIGLHDDTGHFYAFIPRQWPYLWEKHIKQDVTKDPVSFRNLLLDSLIHQDIVSFAQGLRAKVTEVVRVALAVILVTYDQFRDLPFNQPALAELESNSVASAFEHFA